jgi:hypothetical protein
MDAFTKIAKALNGNSIAEILYKTIKKRIFAEHKNSKGADIGARKDGAPVNVKAFESEFIMLGKTEFGFPPGKVSEINTWLQERFGSYVAPQKVELRKTIEKVLSNKK